MKVTVMGILEAEGTTTECAEYTAKTVLILGELAKRMEKADIQNEIQNIWNNLNKEGDKRNDANP